MITVKYRPVSNNCFFCARKISGHLRVQFDSKLAIRNYCRRCLIQKLQINLKQDFSMPYPCSHCNSEGNTSPFGTRYSCKKCMIHAADLILNILEKS